MSALQNPARSLPADRDAERGILAVPLFLGSTASDSSAANSAVDLVAATLLDEDFHFPEHRELMALLRQMRATETPIDLLTLNAAVLQRRSTLLTPAILADLHSISASPQHLGHYIGRVKNASIARQCIAACLKSIEQLFDADYADGPAAAVEELRAALDASLRSITAEVGTPVHKMWGDVFDVVQHGRKATESIATGFTAIDQRTRGGPKRGQLVVVASFRHVGKTAFLRQIALNAGQAGKNVLCVFMESGEGEEGVNSLAVASGIAGADLDGEKPLATGTVQALGAVCEEAPPGLRFDTEGRQTIDAIVSKCRLLKLTHGLDVICLDYLQLIAGKPAFKGQNFEQILNDAAGMLKRLARELNVVLYVGAQLVDGDKRSAKTPPEMDHVRDCKAISNHADVFLGLSAPEGIDHDPDHAGVPAQRHIWNRKWRGVGAFSQPFTLDFKGSTQQFSEG